MRNLFDPPDTIVLEKLLLVRRMAEAVSKSQQNARTATRPTRPGRAPSSLLQSRQFGLPRTMVEYHECEVLPRMRRKAAALIQENMGLLVKLLQRNYSHALQAAIEVGRIDGDSKQIRTLAVYDAFPQLLNSAMKFLRAGESKGHVVCTYLGWGLRAWASIVFEEKRRQSRSMNRDDGFQLTCVECHRTVTYAESEIERFRKFLSERELFVLAKLAAGYTLSEIAGRRSKLKEIKKIKETAFKKLREASGELQQ